MRDEKLKQVNPKLLAGSALADGLAREYTLNEIAIITRAGPARLLGLHQKGHLGAGRGRGRHGLRPGRGHGTDVRHPTLRGQRGDPGGRGGTAAARTRRPPPACAARL